MSAPPSWGRRIALSGYAGPTPPSTFGWVANLGRTAGGGVANARAALFVSALSCLAWTFEKRIIMPVAGSFCRFNLLIRDLDAVMPQRVSPTVLNGFRY